MRGDLSRRSALGLAGAALLAPRRLGAADTVAERKLLVVLCQGGWDPTRLFNPAFGNENVDMEDDAEPMTVGGFTLVDSPNRPSVREWFSAWHDRAAIINGLEVRSITHERCLRLLFTGDGAAAADDWPSVIAAHSQVTRPLPYLVLSGPAYNARYTGQVVRVGDAGQLPDLLSGAALPSSVVLPSDATTGLQEELLRRRLARATAGRGAESTFLAGYSTALDAVSTLRSGSLDLSGGVVSELCGGVAGQLLIALDAFEADRARCALVQYMGNCGPNWDQHSDIAHQSVSFEELFQHLTLLTEELAARPGVAGGTLLDEVTVLVCSEMGRHPKVNLQGGKDHWTYTSCMLFGAGIQGDTVVGGYDATAFGDGSLLPENVGATLYALTGLDPAEHVDAAPIDAVIA